MARRKKYPKLPNGYGSIKWLGKGRRNPYAVHPPTTEFTLEGYPMTPKALCYVDTWEKGFAVLTAYKNGFYYKGYENTIPDIVSDNKNVSSIADFILAEYNRSKGLDKKTFKEIYDLYFADKFDEIHGNSYSKSTKAAITTAYKKCKALYNRPFEALTHDDLQTFMDNLTCGYASQENVLFLLNQMYKYSLARDYVNKNYASGLKIIAKNEEEHGVPFSDEELCVLWEHKTDYIAELLLIMSYSGYRVSAWKDMKIDLTEKYFQGGVKTEASKNRIVPIHSCIYDMVQRRLNVLGCIIDLPGNELRAQMYEYLRTIGIQKHTPHDCRHTFSRLCEKYGVRENDRKRMLGHKIGDITNDVYGHRTVDELREEIEKIQKPKKLLNQEKCC